MNIKTKIPKGLAKNEYQKLYQRIHRKKLRRERKCIKCFDELSNKKKYCDPCLEKERDRNKKSRMTHREVELERGRTKHYNYKLLALQKVSKNITPKCNKCNFSDIRALTINHKNGNGGIERARQGGTYIAIATNKRNIDDLEVLCCNCNKIFEYERGRHKLPIHMR